MLTTSVNRRVFLDMQESINFCAYLFFPNFDRSDYNLWHTGNCGIEAIHGTFIGGTSSLPITSPNFSFQEFLEKMNAA